MNTDQIVAEAVSLEQARNLAGAEKILRRGLELHPVINDERLLLRLGWVLEKQRRSQDAQQYFSRVFTGNLPLLDPPAHGSAFDVHCTYLFNTHGVNAATFEAVETLCQHEIRKYDLKSWTALYMGAVMLHRGAEEEALRYFEKCVELGDSYLGNTYGSFTFKGDDFIAALEGYTPTRSAFRVDPQSPQMKHAKRESDRVVYVLSCDGFYFSRFGEKMAASINRFGRDAICHSHIINPSPESDAVIAKIRDAYPGLRLNITSSAVAFDPKASKLNRKAFFTCGRFLILPALLEHYGLPVLVSEFDGVLAQEPAFYAEELSGVDVALSFYDHINFFPWNQVWAGTVFAANNALGKQFAKLLANYCAKFLDRGDMAGNMWHVDQNALACVHRYMCRKYPELKLQNVKGTLPGLIDHHGGIY